jgi:inner membrane protein YidH
MARDHMANTRTFLAWLRTAITLVALGFVVARFGLFLRVLRATSGAAGGGSASGFSAVVGVALVLVGVLLAGLATRRFLTARKRIDEGRPVVSVGLEVVAGVAIFAAGLGLAGYLLVSQ